MDGNGLGMRAKLNGWDLELERVEMNLTRQLNAIRETRRGLKNIRVALVDSGEIVAAITNETPKNGQEKIEDHIGEAIQGEIDKIIDSATQSREAAVASAVGAKTPVVKSAGPAILKTA